MNIALDYPAREGRVVMQKHADYCASNGHATWTVDDVDQGQCPRCGDDTAAATAEQGHRITTEDGTVLTSATDLGLAWEWAAHEHGPEAWGELSHGQQCAEASTALASLRAAAQ